MSSSEPTSPPQYTPPATLPPVQPQRNLPLGVAILSVLIGLLGIFLVVVGVLILVAGTVTSLPMGVGFGTPFHLGAMVIGAIVLIAGLIVIGIAVALWRLRLWALVLGLIVLFFVMVSYGVAHNFLSIGFLLALVLFIYLLAVNRHFR